MPNIVIPCMYCKEPNEFQPGEVLKQCTRCHAPLTRLELPEEGMNSYRQAIDHLHSGEFRLAEQYFQATLAAGDSDAEAYYGRVLCHYGVWYVEDPHTGRRYPRVRSYHGTPMQELSDFRKACDKASAEVRERYLQEAEMIGESLARFREMMQSGERYDVVISGGYANGEALKPDAEAACELQEALKTWGYRTFLSCPGHDGDAEINHAVATARLMLVVCSDKGRMSNPWVRSEWLGFLNLADEDKSRQLVALRYGDLPEAELPREFRARYLKSIDMRDTDVRFSASSELLSVVQQVCGVRSGPVVAAPMASGEPAQVPKKEFNIIPLGEDRCLVSKYLGAEETVVIPPTIEGRYVLGIGKGVFADHPNLRCVQLPEGLDRMADNAFTGCRELERVVLPASLAAIGTGALDGCPKLREICVEEGNARYYADACVLYSREGELIRFPEGKQMMDPFVAPENVVRIAAGAFAGCSGVRQIVLPAGLQQIAPGVFNECGNLLSIQVSGDNQQYASEDGVLFTRGGELLCYPPMALRTVYSVPENVRRIGGQAFLRCRNLEKVILPEGLESISHRAFVTCSKLTELQIPGTKTRLEEKALVDCPSTTLVVKPGTPAEEYTHRMTLHVRYIAAAAAPAKQQPSVQAQPQLPLQEEPQPAPAPAVVQHRPRVRPAAFVPADRKRPEFTEQAHDPKPEKPAPAPEPVKPELTPDYRLAEIPGGYMIEKYNGASESVQVPQMIDGRQILEIGPKAFAGSRVRRVKLPGTVKKLGERAFEGCAWLEAAALPVGLTEMGERVFEGCVTLRELTIPENNKVFRTVGNVLFRQDGALVLYPRGLTAETYTVPVGIRIIGEGAFRGVAQLRCVVLPAGLARLGDGAFEGCTALEEVCIPDGMTEIGVRCFSRCMTLKIAVIPDSVTIIGGGAFQMCPNVELYVGRDSYAHRWAELNGLKTVLPAPQDPWAAFQTREVSGGCSVCGYTGSDPELAIPAEIRGAAVVSVGEKAFRGNRFLTRVTIPEGVTTVERSAFEGCTALTAISLPLSLNFIDATALKNCPALQEILVDAEHRHFMLYQGVLFNKKHTKGVPCCGVLLRCPEALPRKIRFTIPKSTTAIGAWAFSGCTRLREIWVRDHVTSINEGAFDGCGGLLLHVMKDSYAHGWAEKAGVKYELEESTAQDPYADFVTEDVPGGCMVTGYTGLAERLSIPQEIRGKRVVAIGERAFADQLLISYVVVPEGVTEICDDAFLRCGRLTELCLPTTLERISVSALTGCFGLNKLAMSNANATMMTRYGLLCSKDGVLLRCPEGLRTSAFSMPAGVRAIGPMAFMNCAQLKTLNLDKVTSIGENAFLQCTGLESVTVPEGVERLPEGVFSGCTSLKTVTLPESLASIDANAFRNCSKIRLRVYNRSYAYRFAIENAYSFEVIDGAEAAAVPVEAEWPKQQSLQPAQPEPAGDQRLVAQDLDDDWDDEGWSESPEKDFRVRRGSHGDVIITRYRGRSALVVVPQMIGGRLVTAIAPGAFEDSQIEEIVLPNGVETIGKAAFRGCHRLEYVQLPERIARIDNEAFKDCSCLEEINLPERVKLGKRVFIYCDSLPEEIRSRSVNGIFGKLF